LIYKNGNGIIYLKIRDTYNKNSIGGKCYGVRRNH